MGSKPKSASPAVLLLAERANAGLLVSTAGAPRLLSRIATVSRVRLVVNDGSFMYATPGLCETVWSVAGRRISLLACREYFAAVTTCSISLGIERLPRGGFLCPRKEQEKEKKTSTVLFFYGGYTIEPTHVVGLLDGLIVKTFA